MAHFAQIDDNNIVIKVLRIEQEVIDTGKFGDTSKWVQTSYNGNIRGRFAGIGYTYNDEKDIFIEPQPYPSWRLDENNEWIPPIGKEQPAPDFDNNKHYVNWNEDAQAWVEGT